MSARFKVLFIIARLFACAKILRKFPTTLLVLRCFLVYCMHSLLIQLDITLGVEVMTLDNVPNTYTMVLLVIALALNAYTK